MVIMVAISSPGGVGSRPWGGVPVLPFAGESRLPPPELVGGVLVLSLAAPWGQASGGGRTVGGHG